MAVWGIILRSQMKLFLERHRKGFVGSRPTQLIADRFQSGVYGLELRAGQPDLATIGMENIEFRLLHQRHLPWRILFLRSSIEFPIDVSGTLEPGMDSFWSIRASACHRPFTLKPCNA